MRREPASRPMQAAAGGHREAVEELPDLAGRETFPLGEQEHLPIPRSEPAQRLMYEFGSGVANRWRTCGLGGQLLVEGDASAARTSLVRDDPPRGCVEPHARRIPCGKL